MEEKRELGWEEEELRSGTPGLGIFTAPRAAGFCFLALKEAGPSPWPPARGEVAASAGGRGAPANAPYRLSNKPLLGKLHFEF